MQIMRMTEGRERERYVERERENQKREERVDREASREGGNGLEGETS